MNLPSTFHRPCSALTPSAQTTSFPLKPADGRRFLDGDELTRADFRLVPQLYHVFTALPAFDKECVPDSCTHLRAYFDRAMATDTFKKASYPAKHIVDGWKRKLASAA